MGFLNKVRILAAPAKKISPQEGLDKKFFGPVYHGTDEANRAKIVNEGFKVQIGDARQEGISHGYEISSYAAGKPAPVHHLGFGIYFTSVKAIGKQFNNNSAKGLKSYYIDAPRLESINLGSPNTMMKWWIANGYNMDAVTNFMDPQVAKDRLKATINLTNKLKEKYDAVWFKGKGLYKLLDGDQIVVFDPSRIYEIDPTLASGMETGGKIKRKADGMIGVIRSSREISQEHKTFHPKEATKFLTVKWKKGGMDYNVYDSNVDAL